MEPAAREGTQWGWPARKNSGEVEEAGVPINWEVKLNAEVSQDTCFLGNVCSIFGVKRSFSWWEILGEQTVNCPSVIGEENGEMLWILILLVIEEMCVFAGVQQNVRPGFLNTWWWRKWKTGIKESDGI